LYLSLLCFCYVTSSKEIKWPANFLPGHFDIEPNCFSPNGLSPSSKRSMLTLAVVSSFQEHALRGCRASPHCLLHFNPHQTLACIYLPSRAAAITCFPLVHTNREARRKHQLQSKIQR
jgi:hypothetical protein